MNDPRVVESVTNECQSLGRAHESSSARAEQLIACLEGEIAKRDAELAACRVAVENCEVFRARIVELEALSVTKVMLDIVPGDGDGYEVYAKSVSDVETKLGELGEENEELQFEREQIRAELAAIKAQEPVAYISGCYRDVIDGKSDRTPLGAELAFVNMGWIGQIPLYAAPVSEAKAHGTVGEVVGWYRLDRPYEMTSYPSVCATWHKIGAPVAPVYAAPVYRVKAQGVVIPDVNAAAKALCNRHAIICGVDADDQWKEYSQDFIADAETVLANARLNAAPVSSGDPEKCSYQDDPRSPAELSLAGCNCVRFGECNPHWPCKLHTPAADAGLVDMYRHLQTVTPYRFKKIQDASITDGGDVMYFHKDRFDAALLADMAAHCAAKGVV